MSELKKINVQNLKTIYDILPEDNIKIIGGADDIFEQQIKSCVGNLYLEIAKSQSRLDKLNDKIQICKFG